MKVKFYNFDLDIDTMLEALEEQGSFDAFATELASSVLNSEINYKSYSKFKTHIISKDSKPQYIAVRIEVGTDIVYYTKQDMLFKHIPNSDRVIGLKL